MLILKRRVGQRIWIGRDVVLFVDSVGRNWVKVGFVAPPDVKIDREEKRIFELDRAEFEGTLELTPDEYQMVLAYRKQWSENLASRTPEPQGD